MTFTVLLRPEEDGDPGWVVNCPALPGCWSQGETKEEALDNIREAISLHLAASAEQHPIPIISAQVEVAV